MTGNGSPSATQERVCVRGIPTVPVTLDGSVVKVGGAGG